MSLVSVIVPAYNIKDELPACLDSILNQTYTDLEILLVDDGSTDETAAICDGYIKKDSRIRLLRKANGGLSDARNKALDEVRGDYIAYVDGDDKIEPDMISTMVKASKEYGAPLVCCGYNQIGEGAEIRNYTGSNWCLSKEAALFSYVTDDEKNRIYNSVWSKLYKTDVFGHIRFEKGRCSEDILYTTQALLLADRVAYVDKPLYDYVLDRTGSIMNASEKLANRRFDDELPFTHEQSERFRKSGYTDIADRNEYKLARKELFYYLDFRNRGMKEAARKLHRIMKSEKAVLLKLYSLDFIKTGDRVRLRLFLAFPGLYYYVVKLYDGVIIPIRLRLKAR